LRGQFNIAQGMVNWTVGGFRALNTNDILPISSPLVGHEFFQNAGNTLRQGIEANVTSKIAGISMPTTPTSMPRSKTR
jgi:hypothetical protein